MNTTRCAWVNPNNPHYIDYHDREWGVPVHDDCILFEFLILESAQAGLSWETILKRRESYKKAYKNFDPAIVSKFKEKDIQRLLQDEGIIRNKAKIKASIVTAQVFLDIQRDYGSFSKYLWKWVGGKPIQSNFTRIAEMPTTTELSRNISNDLKKRGVLFFGPTIAYAYMQAVGLTNDHTKDCFCHIGAK
jgi:DNA-3-methyladenine glycosylase I